MYLYFDLENVIACMSIMNWWKRVVAEVNLSISLLNIHAGQTLFIPLLDHDPLYINQL